MSTIVTRSNRAFRLKGEILGVNYEGNQYIAIKGQVYLSLSPGNSSPFAALAQFQKNPPRDFWRAGPEECAGCKKPDTLYIKGGSGHRYCANCASRIKSDRMSVLKSISSNPFLWFEIIEEPGEKGRPTMYRLDMVRLRGPMIERSDFAGNLNRSDIDRLAEMMNHFADRLSISQRGLT